MLLKVFSFINSNLFYAPHAIPLAWCGKKGGEDERMSLSSALSLLPKRGCKIGTMNWHDEFPDFRLSI